MKLGNNFTRHHLITRTKNVSSKTHNLAIQFVLQQCCKTSCTFLHRCLFYRSFSFLILWLTEKSPLVPLYPQNQSEVNQNQSWPTSSFHWLHKISSFNQSRLLRQYHVRHVHTMPYGSCVNTKTIPDRYCGDTYERWFPRDFCNGAKLCRADLERGASHIR